MEHRISSEASSVCGETSNFNLSATEFKASSSLAINRKTSVAGAASSDAVAPEAELKPASPSSKLEPTSPSATLEESHSGEDLALKYVSRPTGTENSSGEKNNIDPSSKEADREAQGSIEDGDQDAGCALERSTLQDSTTALLSKSDHSKESQDEESVENPEGAVPELNKGVMNSNTEEHTNTAAKRFVCNRCEKNFPRIFFTPDQLRKNAKRQCHLCVWESKVDLSTSVAVSSFPATPSISRCNTRRVLHYC